jgi:hypothetical protein
MNNLHSIAILTAAMPPMSDRAARGARPMAGNPRQIRLGEEAQ